MKSKLGLFEVLLKLKELSRTKNSKKNVCLDKLIVTYNEDRVGKQRHKARKLAPLTVMCLLWKESNTMAFQGDNFKLKSIVFFSLFFSDFLIILS